MSLYFGVPHPWLQKEKCALLGSFLFPCFPPESKAAPQQHLGSSEFRVLRVSKEDKSFAASATAHSPSLSLLYSTNKPMGMKGAPTAAVTFSSDDVVLKSPNDRRLYRLIHLQNGLRALLVHDPEAAAAMCVGIGSFSDPYEAQGLAHFLEHMLFMGSDEFPDENEKNGLQEIKPERYLSKHGGSSNAYTETEYTCYHFEVKREFLKGALRRFSQFFISPLVKMEAMEREVLAVDSEFNQVLQSDACRLQQLQCHTAAPNHPLNRFFWGNKKSLVDAMEKGINLREQIFRLYKDYYHGGLMKLVVIGGESLDVLESWVVELFGSVKKGPQVNPEFKVESPIWKSGKIYRLEAVKDVHILDLSWTLPCLHQEYLKKPEDYLAHLLGHEGRGSLLSFLKARGWATSLSAGVGDEGIYRSSIAYVFVMSIHLTDSGVEKVFRDKGEKKNNKGFKL
ncbi:Peptidase M16, zinc-binding site [Sesbania bispinosa]|nr:Peptidase M16, zinc-binding site [Sesbania bispinosa]